MVLLLGYPLMLAVGWWLGRYTAKHRRRPSPSREETLEMQKEARRLQRFLQYDGFDRKA